MLERCRLFLIIALGETVLTTGTAIAAVSTTLITVVTGTAALVGTIALWRLGFGQAGNLALRYMEETRDPARASHHAVSVLMVMVAGLICVAVGNEVAIAHPDGPTVTSLRLLLFGGPILVVLAQGWYFWALLRVWPRVRLLGSAALLLVGVAAWTVPPAGALVLAGATLAILGLLDRP